MYTNRTVSGHGETLVVLVVEGRKALIDPCDESTIVHVPSGRRARLVRFSFNGFVGGCGRDTLTVTFKCDSGLGFARVGCSDFRVLLRDLPEGQVVDILPATEPAVVYAAIRHPLPVLYGAVAVEPIYQYQLAA